MFLLLISFSVENADKKVRTTVGFSAPKVVGQKTEDKPSSGKQQNEELDSVFVLLRFLQARGDDDLEPLNHVEDVSDEQAEFQRKKPVYLRDCIQVLH